MNQEVLCKNCESCESEVRVLDLRQEPGVILCDLCKPWVLNSIYEVPKQSMGINIENPLLFKVSLKLTENFQPPKFEEEWYLFFKHIFSKALESPEDEESDMLRRIRLDYASRMQIYCSEATSLYYGPEFNRETHYDWWELAKLSPYDGQHPFFDDNTVHYDCILDIHRLIDIYGVSLNTIEAEKKHLEENGWASYAEQMTWREFEPQIHDLYGTKISTKQILDCLDLVNTFESVDYFLIGQIIFDFICDEGKISLNNRINKIKRTSEIVDKCKLEYTPTSPFFYQIIANLVKGKYGQNLQYLMLGSLYHWHRDVKSSHNFLVRDDIVWARSFQLLKGIITSLGLKRANIKHDHILIKGNTSRWYSIKPAIFKSDLQWWMVSNAKTGQSICIDILEVHKDLPLGDQLSSLVLTLANDDSITNEVYTLDGMTQLED